MLKALASLLVFSLALPVAAHAQDEAGSRRNRKAQEADLIREIERGVYLKAAPGAAQYILNYRGIIRPVLALDLAVGQDFIDQEKLSMAWEIEFGQALHNGPKLEELSALPGVVQGDIHTFSGIGFLEASGYLTRRFGIGIRGGAGVTMVPILMEPTAYANDVELGAWGGIPSTPHSGPLPTFGGGPTLEYYTKLSHFSVGADIDVLYILGLDLALAPAGYLKYTF